MPRFFLVLNANATGNYSAMGLVMLISALAPFIFLNRNGRKKIGITRPAGIFPLLFAIIGGLIASGILFLLGDTLYGSSNENWYFYIGKSYMIPEGIAPNERLILFLIMAFVGMIFSPIGEELFFRGIVHSSFAGSVGEKKATIIDSSAFALTHISHFGLVFIDGKWDFYTLPTLIWVISMFLVSLLFLAFKKQSDSILGAIICHSAFNLGMIYCIFYLL
ncbi:MAG TPA: CPBP family intramembrane glutamic endopeptidase [Algoriphagus sp.]|nr:CPBP family intramembrane glutamic endopeptidase [Algoriphagus sp.]